MSRKVGNDVSPYTRSVGNRSLGCCFTRSIANLNVLPTGYLDRVAGGHVPQPEEDRRPGVRIDVSNDHGGTVLAGGNALRPPSGQRVVLGDL